VSNLPPTARLRDPLRGFQFQILLDSLDGSPLLVCGVQRISGLTHSVTSFDVWEGGNNLHRYANPDKVNWDPITLEQGLALDDTLELWAAAVRHFSMTGQLLAAPTGSGALRVKRNLIIEVRDPVFSTAPARMAGQGPPLGRRYRVFNAWVSKYSALPRLDALAAEVALMSVELIHEGWVLEPIPAQPAVGA
jgi:phage tail-like protein